MSPSREPIDENPPAGDRTPAGPVDVRLTREPIEVETLTAALSAPEAGAVVTFLGTVRDHHQGRRVRALAYEAYEAMARPLLAEIALAARDRFGLSRVAVVHRLGDLAIGGISIFIGVSAPHREEAFAAARHLIDTIKEQVPIWKKEFYDDGAAWIEGDRPAGL